MIERIRPDNSRCRNFMRLVAATATSLAAGTAVVSCDKEEDDWNVCGGSRPDTYSDADGGENSDDSDTNVDSQ